MVFCFSLVPTVSKFDWNINLFPGSGDEVLLMATGFQSSIGENLPEWSLRKRKAPENDERLDDSQLIFVHQKSPIALHWLSGQLFSPPDINIFILTDPFTRNYSGRGNTVGQRCRVGTSRVYARRIHWTINIQGVFASY